MRTEITQTHVDLAAETIKATGNKVTARGILQNIGSGSLTTILPMLQNWKSGQVREPYKSVELPEGLNKVIVEFIEFQRFDAQKPLREKLDELKDNEVELVKESTRQLEEIVALNITVESLQVNNAVLSRDFTRVESELANAHKSLADERAEHEKLRTSSAVLSSKFSDLHNTANQLESQLKTTQSLMHKALEETSELRDKLDNERTAHEASRISAAVSNSKLEDAMAVIEGLKSELESSYVTIKNTFEEAAELRGKLNASAKSV